ncbi:aKG-HExxH-type peptide beta-hydroxylase [Sphingomonas pokkalii]|uniref:HEXXH motif domain-containing protein n=1 Tax=Sphingomonas pokkalii TaxID=2175090 RepID=A0A2U0SDA1_9SPHN|nr:HEXXH motif-containing putative peptide modification protein [Sphingomonas pokkalii]PVX29356.1 HEXXH motif domain-containing protein [Sphingomonas pokkalii]
MQRPGDGMIDWGRVAKPQEDGSDTAAIEWLIEASPPPWHPVDPPPAAPAEAARVEGTVSVGPHGGPVLPGPRFVPLDDVPATVTEAVALVRHWPAMARQWPRIVHQIQPFADSEASHRSRLGSCSHNVRDRFGVIAMTTECPLGTAQAIVHETAHHKLRAMGVDNEAAIRIIRNPPDQVFHSPVVGRPRPMTALLHAHYSFVHVIELDLAMLRADSDPARRADILTLLGRNVPRVAESGESIERHAMLDEPGERFIAALLDWTAAALAEGEKALRNPR